MKTKIIASEVIEDGEEMTKWTLDQGDGTVIYNLDKLLDAPVLECNWIDDKENFLSVMYSEWDSTEHFAIVSKDGRVIKKGIKEIHHFIEGVHLFVVQFSGFGLSADDSTYYNVAFDNLKMAVIDTNGKYILSPEYEKIEYFDDENVLYADGNIYDFKGQFIKKEA